MPDVHEHRGYLPGFPHRRPARFYDAVTRFAGVPRLHKLLVTRADIAPGMRVLEIGCGTGNLVRVARRTAPTTELTGVDPDPAAVALARRKVRGARFDVGYAQELPYADATFDRVLSSLMLHHIPEDERVATLRETRRVLVPDGVLTLLDMAGHRHHERAHAHHGARVPELMREAGFVDVEVTDRDKARFGPVLVVRGTSGVSSDYSRFA